MTEQEAIKEVKRWTNILMSAGRKCVSETAEAQDMAINALEEVQQYRAIGTIEELQKAEKEEDILKFYYCDSEDSYLVGLRIGNYYYAHYIDGRWVFDMSRHLPWGEHVVDDTAAWKEHTYPSEPKEINFSEWINGFMKKECGGTIAECRSAVEKQKAKKPKEYEDKFYGCPTCGNILLHKWEKYPTKLMDKKNGLPYCFGCGQKLDWSDEE